MCRRLRYYILLISSAPIFAKEPELPLCPANIQFLPQQLPMHCRLPNVPHPVPPAPFPPFYPGVNPGRPAEHNQAVPVPPIPGFPPGFSPGGPPGLPPGVPPGFPPGMPPGMPMAMPMPMPGAPPSAKLPVIVMPFYSPDPGYKQGPAPNLRPRPRPRPYKRRVRKRRDSSSTETDTSSSETDSSDSDVGWWRKGNRRSGRRTMEKHRRRRHKKSRENLLTPVLQYVNKDGYVIYEKQISNGEAKGWLGTSNDKPADGEENMPLEIPDLEKRKSKEEGDVVVATTQAPQETPVVQIKIKKKTVKRRHHKPTRIIEQPVTTQEEHHV